jgi:hypothetical protein
MKKAIIAVSLAALIIVLGAILSYSVSKVHANRIVRESKMPVSPLKGRLIVFIDDEFLPCWLFRGEFENAMTGATFDVHVSLFGRVLKSPPHTEKTIRNKF